MKGESKWDETWNKIHTPECEMSAGVTDLYAKEIDGVWHYAIVWWWYTVPTVMVEFANGQVTYGEE